MFFTAVFTIWQREVIRYGRDRIRIITSLIQPLMFLAVFGAGLSNTLSQGNFGVDFVKFMYPGIVAMSVMGVAFFSTISTVYDREFGFLKEIMVAPVSRTAIALGKTLGATTIAALQALLLLIIAPIIGLTLHWSILPVLSAFMLLLSFAIAGMGLLISSLMKTTESFGLLMQVLIMPMFFLSGAFFPLTNVPHWMELLSRINPLTYGVDAMRQVILYHEVPAAVLDGLTLFPNSVNTVFLVGFSFIMVALAVHAFNRQA